MMINWTQNDFSKLVMDKIKTGNYTYMEAILAICEEKEIDPGAVKKLLTKPIVEKLQAEAQDLHYLKGGSSKLPL